MTFVDPSQVFKGNTVFTVPHMDDGVLACGGTIAKLSNKEQVYIIYATDGMASPAPVLPWRDSVSEELGKARINEARGAMGSLGISKENIHFLGFPDGRLKKHSEELNRRLSQLFEQIRPAHVFVPFRYDQHTDHLALNHAVTDLLKGNSFKAQKNEYFVYYRYRLLPQRDLRKYIIPKYLRVVDIKDVSDRKRAALDYFKSQTTSYYAWQTRPNLSSWLLDEVSQSPEYFVYYDESLPGTAVFKNSAVWIQFVHKLEPFVKKRKDQTEALLRRGMAIQ
jgi:LmbE family N-acetylglucosaminyl deacetylase